MVDSDVPHLTEKAVPYKPGPQSAHERHGHYRARVGRPFPCGGRRNPAQRRIPRSHAGRPPARHKPGQLLKVRKWTGLEKSIQRMSLPKF